MCPREANAGDPHTHQVFHVLFPSHFRLAGVCVGWPLRSWDLHVHHCSCVPTLCCHLLSPPVPLVVSASTGSGAGTARAASQLIINIFPEAPASHLQEHQVKAWPSPEAQALQQGMAGHTASWQLLHQAVGTCSPASSSSLPAAGTAASNRQGRGAARWKDDLLWASEH